MDKFVFKSEIKNFMESSKIAYAVYQFIDNRVVTLILSDGFCRLFGYEDKAKAYRDMDRDMYRLTHPDDVARIANEALRFATRGGSYEVLYRTRTENCSDYKLIHAVGEHFQTSTGVRLAQVWYMDEGSFASSDAAGPSLKLAVNTALREESFTLEQHYDHLTGMPALAYFFELAKDGVEAIRRAGGSPAILYFDLVGMKFFNRKYSFAEGDNLLRAFAQVLSFTFSNENCCHIGGDHFVVYTEEEKLKETLRRLFLHCREINSGRTLPVHVGIYSLNMEDVPISTACDRAKIACDMIRKNYESGYSEYNRILIEKLERHQYILDNLDRAIEEGWIRVYYQPIIRAVNGRVCDEEALARWIDPVMGTLAPSEFIPTLEDAGVIYKLDLCVLDQVLQKIHRMQDEGLRIVPQSINLSRSDFITCDIVEEVRSRVDASGIGHDKISVEITESMIGGDFDFMKEQIERFRSLGFPVWMDDFGTGYSSMDVLQGIRFDLIKFDMSFLKKFDESDAGKIILTEMMKIASALGLDTVCEGVENESQAQFLREIGCNKLQGFYFTKPISLDAVLERYRTGKQIGFENPAESEYYDSIGRLSLHDLTVIENEDKKAFRNVLGTLPMGILEISGDKVSLIRTNETYLDFIERFYGYRPAEKIVCDSSPFTMRSSFMKQASRCREDDRRIFFDEKMPDGSTVYYYAGWIDENPVTHAAAIAVVVLSVVDQQEGASYADIARALAADYYNIYYVDLKSGDFIEYSSPVGKEELAMERHGKNFFETAKRDTMARIYEEDREAFLNVFNQEQILRELDVQGFFTITYRLIDSGTPTYVSMKVSRTLPDKDHIILGVSIIDFQMKEKEAEEKLKREQLVYQRIAALSGNYLSLYTVDPETGAYIECRASEDYESLGLAKTGDDFFEKAYTEGKRTVHPDDLPEYLNRINEENIMSKLRNNEVFSMQYRLILRGESVPIKLKAALVQESDGEKLIVGLSKLTS